ncbi:MAG: VOC family protein [Acidimicrobiales bacterium]
MADLPPTTFDQRGPDEDPDDEPGGDYDLEIVDTDGDGRPDTIVRTLVEGVDTDGDGMNDVVVVHRESLIDTDGDGHPDVLERSTTTIGDARGDGGLDVDERVEHVALDAAGGFRVGPLQHASVNVADVGAALGFYVGVLGLRPIDRPDIGVSGAWLATTNGLHVHLVESAGWRGDPGYHLAFTVDDIDGAVDALRAAGVDTPDWFDIGAGRQVFVTDPSGNVIELNQPTG